MSHHRKPMNILWLCCSLNTFTVGTLRPQTFPSFPFAFATSKAHSLVRNLPIPFIYPACLLYSHPYSLLHSLPSLPSFLLFFGPPPNPPTNRSQELEKLGKSSSRIWDLKDLGDLSVKGEGIEKETNANYWVNWFIFVGNLPWFLIPL